MLCSFCARFAATTREQLANRRHQMAVNKGVIETAPCTRCGGTEWAHTQEFIRAEPRPWWRSLTWRWFTRRAS